MLGVYLLIGGEYSHAEDGSNKFLETSVTAYFPKDECTV
jgi:hypothetical protein